MFNSKFPLSVCLCISSFLSSCGGPSYVWICFHPPSIPTFHPRSMITLVCILAVPHSQLLNIDDGGMDLSVFGCFEGHATNMKKWEWIANITIVIMSTNQISYVTKPGPKCSSIWRKKILILGLKKMAYMWHYFSFSQKVGCYSKKRVRGGESVIARRTSIHNQISQLSPQKGVAKVTVTNAQHVLYMPSKNMYRPLRNAQVDPILSLAVTHANIPHLINKPLGEHPFLELRTLHMYLLLIN